MLQISSTQSRRRGTWLNRFRAITEFIVTVDSLKLENGHKKQLLDMLTEALQRHLKKENLADWPPRK